jgi:hypothetical protein
MGEKRDAYRILVGRPEGRRPFGRPRRRWEDNIKMDLQAVGLAAWIGLSWLRTGTGARAFVNAVMKLRVSQNVENFFTS